MNEKAEQRLAGLLAADYLLRTADSVNHALDGDLTKGLVFLAVVQANAQSSDAPSRGDDDTLLGCDDKRRPISGGALAACLNVPAETVRRKVKALIAAGYLQRLNGGLVAPSDALDRPEVVRLMRANYLNLRRLFGELRRRGIDLSLDANEG